MTVIAFAVAAAAVLAGAPVAVAAPVAHDPAPAARPAQSEPGGQAVFVGIPGLRWSDVSAEQTPILWQLAGDGALAALSVRTVQPTSCPADGWLTLNSGARSTMRRSDNDAGRPCVAPLEPVRNAAAEFVVPGWPDVLRHNREFSYGPRFGLLAQAASQRGCTTAVGPGAALALADSTGQVKRYASTIEQTALSACPLTVVDLGALPAPDTPDRETAVRGLDADLSRLVGNLPLDTTLFAAGLADSVLQPGHLSAMLANGGPYEGGWLTTASTRHDGLAQITDLTPTLLAAIGVETPPEAVGAVMRNGGTRPDVKEAVGLLADRDRAAQVIREDSTAFFVLLALGQIVAYALLALARRADPRGGRRWLGATEVVALIFAGVPAGTFLANLMPWWRFDRPGLALWLAVTWCCAVVGATAILVSWQPRVIGPAGAVAALTATVLAGDVLAGSELQLSSLYGLSPLVAGRFYGFGNVAFAVFAVSALLAAAWAASWLLDRGLPAVAALAVVVVGAVAVVVDGWPTFGADVGGVLALVPGFALLALGVAGVGISAWRIAAVAAGTVAAVGAIALADWARPATERSHLGRFVQQVIDGDAGAVLARKIDANVSTLVQRPGLGLLVLVALLLAALIVLYPQRLGIRALTRAYAAEPALKPGLVACLVTAVVGFAVNDSGVIVPAVALAVAVPLGVAVSAAAARQR